MNNIKTLRAYANGRKLPMIKLIGNVSENWLEDAFRVYESTPITSDYAKAQREKDRILGTKVDKYEELTEYYNQLHPDSLSLPEEYHLLEGAHHLRFGELKANNTISMHLDEPYTLRGVCVIRGQHEFILEDGSLVVMNPGELYFVNGCYKHSVRNTLNIVRVALLNKFFLTKTNIKVLNELL